MKSKIEILNIHEEITQTTKVNFEITSSRYEKTQLIAYDIAELPHRIFGRHEVFELSVSSEDVGKKFIKNFNDSKNKVEYFKKNVTGILPTHYIRNPKLESNYNY